MISIKRLIRATTTLSYRILCKTAGIKETEYVRKYAEPNIRQTEMTQNKEMRYGNDKLRGFSILTKKKHSKHVLIHTHYTYFE